MSCTDVTGELGAVGTRQREGSVASMGSTSFSVMCVDDNVLLVDALERRLNLETGFDALYRVDDPAQAVADAVRLKPSVILLDMDLPGGVDAMVLLDEIVANVPESRVLIFTGYPSGDLVRRTMSRGAWGFVSKGTTSDRLIGAIRQVVAGQAVIELED
jgi:two-component system response regulator DesR